MSLFDFQETTIKNEQNVASRKPEFENIENFC